MVIVSPPVWTRRCPSILHRDELNLVSLFHLAPMLWPAQGTSVSKGTVYDEHVENMHICVQAHTVHAHRALPVLQRWDHTRDPARTPRVTRPREPALHSCQQPLLFFYICLPFLAPCMAASMSQQGASSWMDQHILFRCPSSQWVGNGFWSKAMLRQCWKERPEDKLQNSKCPVSN